MQATAASNSRAKKGLTLREKIFELHDAVRVLQTTDTTQNRRQQSQNRSTTPENTESNSLLTQKIDGVESQCAVLRQAIGTMADAVADEIEELKKDITAGFEQKVGILTNRVQNAQLSADRTENEQAKIKFHLERLGQDVSQKLQTQSSDKADHQPQVFLAPASYSGNNSEQSEQNLTVLKAETRKLFEQMKNIMQTQTMQI